MRRAVLISGLALLAAGLAGCAAPGAPEPICVPCRGELPGLTTYYERATAPQRRAVRKPVRDERAFAMRMLARQARELLADTLSWDQDARFVSLADDRRSAAQDATGELQVALEQLRRAATNSDVTAVRAEFAHAMAAYRDLRAVVGPLD